MKFQKCTFQVNTFSSLEIINIPVNRVVIFNRYTGELITFCEPIKEEIKYLIKIENFRGLNDHWITSKARNLPPEIPVHIIENDIMLITPIVPMNKPSVLNEASNQRFTPINSFENDVLGIILTDPDW